jgi:hypothetical protein
MRVTVVFVVARSAVGWRVTIVVAVRTTIGGGVAVVVVMGAAI